MHLHDSISPKRAAAWSGLMPATPMLASHAFPSASFPLASSSVAHQITQKKRVKKSNKKRKKNPELKKTQQ
jgi:hypothetical protein